jgi:hypothetical protein
VAVVTPFVFRTLVRNSSLCDIASGVWSCTSVSRSRHTAT